jgi:hypothetical protein
MKKVWMEINNVLFRYSIRDSGGVVLTFILFSVFLVYFGSLGFPVVRGRCGGVLRVKPANTPTDHRFPKRVYFITNKIAS